MWTVAVLTLVPLVCFLWRFMRRKLRQSLEGAAIVVTGCDSGLGFAIAQRLSKEKALVFATCLTAPGIQRCKELGEHVIPIQVDITSDDSVEKLQNFVTSELKKRGATLLGLVNNAGIGNYGFAEALDLNRFQSLLEVNCLGTVRVTKAFLALLRAHGQGARLITIGSLSDRLPAGFGSAYVPTKAYVCWFTESVGFEMRRFGLRASVIEPGFIATELLEAGHAGGAKASEHANEDVQRAYGDFLPMMTRMQKPVMMFEKLNGGKVGGGAWVADSTVDALSSTWPRSRYLVGYDTVLGQLVSSIPGWQRLLGFFFEQEHRAVHPFLTDN